VRYPARELLAVLALESVRRGFLVVGEDLGTVPPGWPATLRRRGILSTRVLYFEKTRWGAFQPAGRYSTNALVSAATHDLPPLAGWWLGRDIALRRKLGLLRGRNQVRLALARRARERASLLHRLRSAGLLMVDGRFLRRRAGLEGDAMTNLIPPAMVIQAVHRFLAQTPSPLAAIGLDDLLGEVEPVNLPGVPPERFPSWTRRMSRAVEELPGFPSR
jgi:4-alpha-glucanotransferase